MTPKQEKFAQCIAGRLTASFEYIGEPKPKAQIGIANALLGVKGNAND